MRAGGSVGSNRIADVGLVWTGEAEQAGWPEVRATSIAEIAADIPYRRQNRDGGGNHGSSTNAILWESPEA